MGEPRKAPYPATIGNEAQVSFCTVERARLPSDSAIRICLYKLRCREMFAQVTVGAAGDPLAVNVRCEFVRFARLRTILYRGSATRHDRRLCCRVDTFVRPLVCAVAPDSGGRVFRSTISVDTVGSLEQRREKKQISAQLSSACDTHDFTMGDVSSIAVGNDEAPHLWQRSGSHSSAFGTA